MIRFSIDYLHRRAGERPPGYLEDVLSHATVADGFATFDDAAYAALVAKYRPAAPAPSGWGPPLWAELHRAAAAGIVTPAFLADFAARLPDGTCGCRGHWNALLQTLPPPPSGADQFAWSWSAHNAVRARLGQDPNAFPLEQARALYEPSHVPISRQQQFQTGSTPPGALVACASCPTPLPSRTNPSQNSPPTPSAP